MLKFDLTKDKKTIIISLGKVLNYKSSNSVNNYVLPFLLKYDIDNLIINFEGVKKIDLTGYNSLLKIRWMMKVKKINLYLDNIPYHLINEVSELNFKSLGNKKRLELVKL